MAETPPERQTDATDGFGDEPRKRTRQVDHRPGVEREHPPSEGKDGERPPLGGDEIDATPLRQRFAPRGS